MQVSREVESTRADAMSYLDNIIETDGWGDKKNSKIFEMYKHNVDKFGNKRGEAPATKAAEPETDNAQFPVK